MFFTFFPAVVNVNLRSFFASALADAFLQELSISAFETSHLLLGCGSRLQQLDPLPFRLPEGILEGVIRLVRHESTPSRGCSSLLYLLPLRWWDGLDCFHSLLPLGLWPRCSALLRLSFSHKSFNRGCRLPFPTGWHRARLLFNFY